MTSSQPIHTTIPGNTRDSRKYWMQFALALSLILHIGAALVVIIASGFSTCVKSSSNFIIEDIALSPSISAPAKASVTQPEPLPAMTSATPVTAPQDEKPAQQPMMEPPSNPPGSAEKEGGLLSTPLGLGMTHGYFSALADGRTLRDDIRSYYFEMVEKINREWWDKAGLLKEPLRSDGVFELMVQRDGTVVSIQLLQSTGIKEADRLIAEIIRKASPLPALPSTYELDLFKAPLRIKAPLFMFRFRNAEG